MENTKQNRILFIPDTIWGNDSGHRSGQKVVKVFCSLNYKIAIYAPNVDSAELKNGLNGYQYEFFERTPYRYYHQFKNRDVKHEFQKVLNDFKPDYVHYFGSTGYSPTARVCLKQNIPYAIQFLTSDYYCIKNFAGLKDGPCFKCITGKYYHAIKNNCQRQEPKFIYNLKDIIGKIVSRKSIMNASKVLGYSNDQISVYNKYGVPNSNCAITPIFFDGSHLVGITPTLGNYFLMSGQNIVAKGWHLLTSILSQCTNVKFKFLFINQTVADRSIDRYNLREFVVSGQIEIIVNIEKHSDVIQLIAHSRGVLVPSYYPTTGEFILLESLGLGKPVITFDAGIHKEIIQHKFNGMIAKIGDTEQFAKNINEINSNNNLCDSISKGAIELFLYLTSDKRFKSTITEIFS